MALEWKNNGVYGESSAETPFGMVYISKYTDMHKDGRTDPYYLVNYPTGIDRFHYYESVEQAQRGAEVDMRAKATYLLERLDGKGRRMTKERLYEDALKKALKHVTSARQEILNAFNRDLSEYALQQIIEEDAE